MRTNGLNYNLMASRVFSEGLSVERVPTWHLITLRDHQGRSQQAINIIRATE